MLMARLSWGCQGPGVNLRSLNSRGRGPSFMNRLTPWENFANRAWSLGPFFFRSSSGDWKAVRARNSLSTSTRSGPRISASLPRTGPPHHLHLEQPVLGHGVPQGHKGVLLVPGHDGGHPEPVSENLYLRTHPGLDLAGVGGHRGLKPQVSSAHHQDDQGTDYPDDPFECSHPPYLSRDMSPAKRSKRYVASWGPGEFSGWYCTQNRGRLLCRKPSRVLSLRLTWVSSTAS